MDRDFPSKPLLLADLTKPQDFQKFYPANLPLVIDIGAGKGEFASSLAQLRPEYNYLCIEKRPDRVRATLKRVQKNRLTNLMVFRGKIEHLFPHCFFRESVHTAYMNFPDPWKKNSYRNRRNLTAEFVQQIWDILIPDGEFAFATDVSEYAEYAFKTLSSHPGFRNIYSSPWLCEAPEEQKTLFYHHAASDGLGSFFIRMKKVT